MIHERLENLWLEYSDFEKVQEILAFYMIYDHDEMILDILQKLNENK